MAHSLLDQTYCLYCERPAIRAGSCWVHLKYKLIGSTDRQGNQLLLFDGALLKDSTKWLADDGMALALQIFDAEFSNAGCDLIMCFSSDYQLNPVCISNPGKRGSWKIIAFLSDYHWTCFTNKAFFFGGEDNRHYYIWLDSMQMFKGMTLDYQKILDIHTLREIKSTAKQTNSNDCGFWVVYFIFCLLTRNKIPSSKPTGNVRSWVIECLKAKSFLSIPLK